MTLTSIAPIARETISVTGRNWTLCIVPVPRLESAVATISLEVSLASLPEGLPPAVRREYRGRDKSGVDADQNDNETVSDHRNPSINDTGTFRQAFANEFKSHRLAFEGKLGPTPAGAR